MKIGWKLIAGYVTIALFTVLISVFSIEVMERTTSKFDEVATDTIPDINVLHDLRFAGARIVASVAEYDFISGESKKIRISDNSQLGKEEDLLRSGIKLYEQSIKRYAQLVERQSPKQNSQFRRIQIDGERLIRTSRVLFAQIKSGESAQHKLKLKSRLEEDENSYMHAVTAALTEEQENFSHNRKSVIASHAAARQRIIMVSAVTFIAAILIGLVVSRSISRRLTSLQAAAEKIGKGELDAAIPVLVQDEVGALAMTFNRMTAALKASRAEIVAAKEFQDDIIHSLMDSLIVVAPDGVICSVNGATCALLGDDEEPVGRLFSDIMPETPFAELIETGFVRNREHVYLGRDGRQIPVAFSGSVMWNQDQTVRGFVCVAQDITERKAAETEMKSLNIRLFRANEELQETNEELKNFAYIASHDLRAPLVNIKGFSRELSEILKEIETRLGHHILSLEDKDRHRLAVIFQNEIPEALGFITSSVSRMDTMISAILKLSRLGRRELSPELVDLSALASGILTTLTHQLEERKVAVKMHDLPEVMVDRSALEQVMGNLLDNAVKYLEPQRPGLIEISAEQEAGETTIRIRDNGRGISPEDMHKVFEIFRRAGRQDVPGDGMGLAYVKALLKGMGGQIRCESEPGVGTTFSFTMPNHS